VAILIALALVLSLGIVAVPMAGTVEASPADLYVDASVTTSGDGTSWDTAFKTISEGIAEAGTGDTINVAAGLYEEEVKIMDKSLTLLGAQADVAIVEGERAGDESIICGKVYPWSGKPKTTNVVSICHSDVVVNGFTIERAKKRNICIIGSGEGISNVLISYCYIQGNNNWGIHRSTSAVNVSIDHNYITSNKWGVLTNGGSTTIINNTFDNNVIGIDFNGGDPYDKYFPDYAEPKYPTIIDNNTFTSDSISIELRLDKCHQCITITGNDITEARSVAISTWAVYEESLVNPAIHYNNIVGNEFGIDNGVAGVNLDATNNWWGDASGPYHPTSWIYMGSPYGPNDSLGDEVSDYVLYDPWLEALYRPTTPMSSFIIDHAKLDFKKKPNDDKVHVRGTLELGVASNGVDISEDVIVTVGPLCDTIKMEQKGKQGEKWEYKRPKGGEGDIKHMTIDWKNGKFDFSMDKADLSGLTDPDEVTISIQIGDDLGEATIQMTETKHWDYKAP